MSRINFLLTLSSLNVLLVTIERFSFTTQVFLQPFNFLRLHEVFQMLTIILATVIIPFFILREVTDNFSALKSTKGVILGTLFITGIYFYATGNGVHELGSFAFNTYCETKNVTGNLCGGLFFNDYYFGNILYFIGAFLMNIVIILFERDHPQKIPIAGKNLAILITNSVVYAFAIFAYSGFDRVLVGLVYSLISMVVIDVLLLTARTKPKHLPFTLYAASTYTLGTLASLLMRLRP